jgi:hypothetical protein
LAFAAVAVAVGGLWAASAVITSQHNSRTPKGDVGGVVTLGKTKQLAKHINGDNQPTFFPDTSGNHLRDLYVQHVGTDLDHGWVVFAAQVPDEGDGCVWQWQRDQSRFRSSCDHARTLAADAPGLYHYPVTVKSGKVKVDLRAAPGAEPATTSTTTAGGG